MMRRTKRWPSPRAPTFAPRRGARGMRTRLHRLRTRRPGPMRLGLLVVLALLAGGCTSAPPGITPVQNFDLESYLGTWYEIARLDHSFERGLSDVRADYARLPDGAISVRNSGHGA